jgi:sigma-B regulation protein RsbU (phosphoserine phosphatase)
MRPANTVGGDYFDLIELDAGHVAVVMADVAGKGIPAALLMALLQASLRTLISAGFRGEDLLVQLDRHLYGNIPTNRLVTCFYGELELASGRLRYVNAGHNPPLVIPGAGPLRRLEATAIVLGAVPDQDFASDEVTIAPGERLFLYTDGLTEAFDASDREYGEERLTAFLGGARGLAPDAVIAGVLSDVLRHCGTARPHDDMTQMIVCHAAPASAAAASSD